MNDSEKIIRILQKRYKEKIYRSDPFRTLIGVILSHQTNDKISWPATDRLFRVAKTPRDFVKMGWRKIDSHIKNVNYHPTKAKRIYLICKMLLERFGGKVPKTREELMELPGVGPKSTSIVLSFGFGIPTIAVDTHAYRVSKRLALVPNKVTAEKTQKILEEIIPKKYHLIANSLLIDFGRDICQAKKPQCFRCPVYQFCKYEKKAYFKNLPPL
jgi:endonuclease III